MLAFAFWILAACSESSGGCSALRPVLSPERIVMDTHTSVLSHDERIVMNLYDTHAAVLPRDERIVMNLIDTHSLAHLERIVMHRQYTMKELR